MENKITRQVRRDIADYFRMGQAHWAGALDEVNFLMRLYDLDKMPSSDRRYSDAAGDIYQHRINNFDWDNDWIFDDARFNLPDASDDEYLRFLAETLHPLVRPEPEVARQIAQEMNAHLARAGFQLVEAGQIHGRPKFLGVRIDGTGHDPIERATEAADVLNAAWMHAEIQRMKVGIDRDPALAIGTAKEFIESCCKTILGERGVAVARTDDLPTLTKKLAKALKLVADDVSESAKGADNIRRILQNFASIAQNMAELRGLYGSGHGRDGTYRGLEPRHARLAVSAAIAFVDFAVSTYRKHEDAERASGRAS